MKVAIYARVSTEKQEQQETVKSQLAALRDFAKKSNYCVVDEYVDEGYSGELLDRPSLDRLRDDAKKKVFDAALIHSPDRLSRKYAHSIVVQEEIKKYGIKIVFLNRPDNKDTPEDNLLGGVQGLISEYEKAKTLERTRRGRLHKAKSGLLVGSRPPYGYRYVRNDPSTNKRGHYVIIENEAKVVRLIFDLFVKQRLSIRAIAKELTKRGIPPQRGKHWRTSSLHRIIRNETYIGTTYYNKHYSCEAEKPRTVGYKRAKRTSRRLRDREKWVPVDLGDSAKIIEKEVFWAAQIQLKRNAEQSVRNTKHNYLLRGLIKCGSCGSPYYSCPGHGKRFYRCGNRSRTFPLPRECKEGSIRAESIESVVWSAFCSAVQNPRLLANQVSKLRDSSSQRKVSVERDLQKVDQGLENLEKERNRLLDAYRENVISMDQLKDQMARIDQKKNSLEKEKNELSEQLAVSVSKGEARKSIKDYCKQAKKRLKRIENDFEAKRHLLSLALNSVVIEGKTLRLKGVIPTYVNEGPPHNTSNSVHNLSKLGTQSVLEYELVVALT